MYRAYRRPQKYRPYPADILHSQGPTCTTPLALVGVWEHGWQREWMTRHYREGGMSSLPLTGHDRALLLPVPRNRGRARRRRRRLTKAVRTEASRNDMIPAAILG